LESLDDVLVAICETVTPIVEWVDHTYFVCQGKLSVSWDNPYDFLDPVYPKATKASDKEPGSKDVAEALQFLKTWGDFLGKFGECFVNSKWSLAQAEVPLDFGHGNVAIPYGVRVTMPATYAERIRLFRVPGEIFATFSSALNLLASLSPEFRELALPGVSAVAAISAAAAALPAEVLVAAQLIAAFVILMLIYGTAISAQLEVAKALGAFDDGEVVIEHPTFAVAALTIGLPGIGSVSQLIPPIVLG
jgi:hypothetical protein